jgi:hypothetical protein
MSVCGAGLPSPQTALPVAQRWEGFFVAIRDGKMSTMDYDKINNAIRECVKAS